MNRCTVDEVEKKNKKETLIERLEKKRNLFSFRLLLSSGCESHQATTCCWPVRIHVLSACLLISSPVIRSFCVPARRCVSVFILECVTHTSCALPMRQSSMEQQDLRSFSILSFSFCFSPSLSRCTADRPSLSSA